MPDLVQLPPNRRKVAAATLSDARLTILDVMASGIPADTGELSDPLAGLCQRGADFITRVLEVHTSGDIAVGPSGQQMTVIAVSLFRASAMACWAGGGVTGLSDFDKSAMSRLASAFFTCFSETRDVYARQSFVSDLSDLYTGVSSKYSRANPFPAMFPADASLASVSGSAIQALLRLESMDVVLSPPDYSRLVSDVALVAAEVTLL